MRYALLISFIITLNILTAKSQGVSIQSPNVASIARQAIVPISSFTGQANVQIPLYAVNYKELSIPIDLNYNTKGNKVKEHPGFVGLGWNMSGGGVISRIVHGITDEHPKRFGNTEYPTEQNYYYNCGKVSDNYTNLEYVKKYGLDGGLDMNFVFDGMPDEFVFNFNGYSGVFYITRKTTSSEVELVFRPNGDYKLKGEILEIKENVSFNDGINTNTPIIVPRCIYGIKITDDSGNIYIFGNSPENIEFGNGGGLSDDNNNIANAWHLSKITSPNGYSIDFTYEKRGKTITPDTYREAVVSSGSYNFSSYSHLLVVFSASWGSGSYQYSGNYIKSSYYFNYPSCLVSIKTPDQEVLLKYSRCNDLQYNYQQYFYPSLDEVLRYSSNYQYDKNSYWQKLDEIEVKELQKIIKLKYREHASSRLKLDTVIFGTKNNDTFQKEKHFSLKYNSLLLPTYESRQADHWGFYSGRYYAYNADYYNNRQPNAQFLKAEILEQIQYPNGGYLNLEYEPHYYRKIASQYPFSVTDQSNDVLAGGLRVKHVESKTDVNTSASKTEYLYAKDFVTGGTVSSGVLSGIPKYTNSGTRYSQYKSGGFWSGGSGSASLYYQIGRDKHFFPLSNTYGDHVTYSEVTEKTITGYVTTKYSNHDNGYLDRVPDLIHSNFNTESPEDPFISNQAYRGLALSIKVYSPQGVLRKEILNTFHTDLQANEGIPFLQRVSEAMVGGWRASSGKYPISPPLLSNTLEKEYLPSGELQSNTTEYQRLSSYVLNGKSIRVYKPSAIIKTNNSKNNVIVNSIKYPHDFLSISAYLEMTNKNMITSVIQKTETKDGKPISFSQVNYDKFNNLYLPKSTEIKIGNHNVYTNSVFSRYDEKGNLLEEQKEAGPKEVYLWGYSRLYPVAKIIGSDYHTVASLVDQGILDSGTDTERSAQLTTLRNQLLQHPGVLVTTYTYKPLVGMKSATDPKGMTTSYEYDEFQRLKAVKDQNGNIIKLYEYKYKQF